MLCLSAYSLAVGAVGAALPMATDGTGCLMAMRGEQARIRPESSELSCADVKVLVNALPPRPLRFSLVGGEPWLLWNCRYFGVRAGPTFLRCNHHRVRHFSLSRAQRSGS